MNKTFIYISAALLLGACATKNAENKYIDLTGNKDAVLNYWLVDKKVKPEYSQQATVKKLAGCVEFSLVIDSNGRAINTKIIKSFPQGAFDKQAIRAIKKWRWVATAENTDKQAVATTIQHDFVIRNAFNKKEAYKHCKI